MSRKRILPLSILCFLLLIQCVSAEILYPWKDVYIGALEGKAWNGLVLAPHKESVFAFRIKAEKGSEDADENDFFYLISEVGPHSPDGRYARIKIDLNLPFQKEGDTPILIKPSPKSGTLVLEWSRQDEKAVIGRIKVPKGIKLHLIHYFPWDFTGEYSILSDGQIKGQSLSSKNYHYLLWTSPKGSLITDSQEEELTVSFSMEKEKYLYFAAGVGEDVDILNNHIYRYKNKKTIDSLLTDERVRYKKARVKVDGLFKGAAKAITNNVFWSVLYQPDRHRFYTPAGRRSIFPVSDGTPDHWTIFGWGSFFNALEVSIESAKHARDIIKAVLETQYPNGNIPSWRGRFGGTPDRSQPPIGSYVVLKLFQRLGDFELLRYAYPYLKKWHSFWKTVKPNFQSRRDGNSDGLLEWGSDAELLAEGVPSWEENVESKQRAMWESSQDDLPNWEEASFSEETGTLTMNCIDLNSLYTLDAYCLAQIANILGLRGDNQYFLSEYETMKELINHNLWDEREGFYFDRHWDGTFSSRKAASNFYPLLARIPDEERAMRMLKHLLNPEEFWGEFVIPTISRDDPSFEDQQSWRGTIWPPTNYLVYQGLKAYQFDVVASEFARKSSTLFLRTWENYQLSPESFDSRTGQAGERRYKSWGPLFALIALEEYLDFTPWEGFRFGIIDPEEKGKLSRIPIQGRHYEVEVSSRKLKLKEEGREIISTNKSAIFRHFLYSENEIAFNLKTFEETKIKVQFLTKGKYELWVDNKQMKVFKGNSLKTKIPEGEHSILILLIEKKE